MGHFEFFPPGEVGVGVGVMPRLVFRKRLRLAQLTLTGGAREVPRLAPSLLPCGGEMSRPVRRLSEVSRSTKMKGWEGTRLCQPWLRVLTFLSSVTSHWFNRPHHRDEPGGVLCANI